MNKIKSIDILHKIIENKGSCNFATPSICQVCFLSKLKTNSAGSYLGCIEAINVVGLKAEEADNRYMEEAQKKLLDIEIEEMLGDKSDI